MTVQSDVIYVYDPKHDRAVRAVRSFLNRIHAPEKNAMAKQNEIAKNEVDEIAEKYANRRAEKMNRIAEQEAQKMAADKKLEKMTKKERDERRKQMEADAAKQLTEQGGGQVGVAPVITGNFGTAKEVNAANRKPAAAKATPSAGNPRFKVFGLYGICPLLRWMGKQGWTKDEARAVLVSLGAQPTENALSLDMAAGAKAVDGLTKYGPMAVPSAEHEAQLATARTAVTSHAAALAAIGEKPAPPALQALMTIPAPPPAAAVVEEEPHAPAEIETAEEAAERKRAEKSEKARARRAAKKA